ncbi:MAG: MFS transporter [Synechococcales bacterium]|nr:MFS transporter [Synechococcales bacterium]
MSFETIHDSDTLTNPSSKPLAESVKLGEIKDVAYPPHSPVLQYGPEHEPPDSPSVGDGAIPVPHGQASASEHGFWPVLKNRNFLALWSGQVFSQIADKVYLVLMIAIISHQFQSSDQPISGWVSVLMIIFTIPAVLFGFLAGVFVDRWPKRAVMVTTNLLRGALVVLLPGLIWLTQGWQGLWGVPIGFFMLLSVTFLVSTLTQFFAPAEQAAIPLLVKPRHLLSANSLYTTTMMASVIIGFALGEPVLELADALIAPLSGAIDIGKELLVGMSYGAAGLLLLLTNTRERGVHLQGDRPQFWQEFWQDIRDGLSYLKGHDRVRSALIQLVILFSVFAALAVLAVRLAEVMPALDADQFGFLLAACGVGMAVGAVAVGQFGQHHPRRRISLIGSIGVAACLAALSGLTQQLIPTLVVIGCLGACAACIGIPMQTTIQAETPEAMRGKVFGLQNNAVNIALSLPLALAGVAETCFGLHTVLLGLSVLVITGGLLTWYSSRKGSASASSPVS